MLQSLNSVLAMNMAIQQFALMPGPAGSECMAGVCQADMVRIYSDAYVVPYVPGSASAEMIRSDVARAGARQEILKFEDRMKREGGVDTNWGAVQVSKSGGGRSENLINVVGMGSGKEDLAQFTIEYIVSTALQAAAQEGFGRIVFAPFLVGEMGDFSAERVARTMFRSVYYHWINDQVVMPKHVLIAVEDKATYLDFKSVLEAEAPFLEDNKAADKMTDKSEKRIKTKEPEEEMGSISRIIYELNPLALTAFFFAIRRKGGTMRERCEELYFFDRIKHLFSEDGGEALHPLTVDKLERRFNELD